MGAKVDAAISAIGGGVQAVVIAPGGERDVIDDIIAGMHLPLLRSHISYHLHSPVISSSHLHSYWIDFSHHLCPPLTYNLIHLSLLLAPSLPSNPLCICTGRKAGTLVLGNTDTSSDDVISLASSTSTLALSDAPPVAAVQVINVEEVAKGARKGSRKLQDISSEERSAVLMQIASSLELREQEILTANMIDVEAAENR